MSVTYYNGTEGVTVDLQGGKELHEALDILHTQIMDNVPEGDEQDKCLRILEEALECLESAGFVS